jgi:hypothetical protein
MRKVIQVSQLAFLFAIFMSIQNVYADDSRGRIVKIQGEVYVIDGKGHRQGPVKTNHKLHKDETVVTQKGAKAVVKFDDGALTVLSQKSSVRVEQSGWLSQLGGKVYYLFRKVVGKKESSKKVKTGFTTIGIRGTTFIVTDEENNKGIALSEGKLNMESPGKAYEIHKQKQADDFETFKRQAQEKRESLYSEYSDYKKQLAKDFVEYKKSFDMEANRVINFNGNRVDETELSGDGKKEFADFEGFAKDHVNAFRELEKETGKNQ